MRREYQQFYEAATVEDWEIQVAAEFIQRQSSRPLIVAWTSWRRGERR